MTSEDDRTLLNTQRVADLSQRENSAEKGPRPAGTAVNLVTDGSLDPTTIVKDAGSAGQPSPALPADEPSRNHVSLPVGHQLFEYTIEALLGSGGFGQTYLARDNHLQCQVAIKEYLPHDLAIRVEGQTVCPRSKQWSDEYQIGLKRFLNEARTLASFRHPNIVRITRFFEANGTAYMVMDYERGQSLRDWKRSHPAASEEELLRMFLPLLEGLAVVHQGNITHRDIKPANIYVRETDGSLVLLDFGSARLTQNLGSQGLTTIITPGYAPFEQYHSHGVQGPWSDIYSMGGVLYWMITGEKPVEAPARLKDDTMVPTREIARGRFSPAFLAAIDWALESDEDKRPRKVADFRAALTGQMEIPVHATASAAPKASAAAPEAPPKGEGRNLKPLWIGLAIAGIASAGLAGRYFSGSKPTPSAAPEAMTTPAPAAERQVPSPALQPKPEASPTAENVAGNVAKPAAEEMVSRPQAVSSAHKASTAPITEQSTSGKALAQKHLTSQPDKNAGKAAKPVRQETVSVAQGGSVDTASMAPAPTAKVALKIIPRGEIFLDGKKIGNSPPLMEIPVKAGQHRLEIRGDALPFVSYHTLDLKAGETKHISQRFGDN